MSLTERKYLNLYTNSIDNETPAFIKHFDFSENR